MALKGKLKTAGILSGCVVLLFALAFFGFSWMLPSSPKNPLDGVRVPQGEVSGSGRSPLQQAPGSPASMKEAGGKEGKEPPLSLEDQLVKELKQLYGGAVFRKSTLEVFQKVKQFLMDLYPQDGRQRFYRILERAFPEQADEIRAALEKMAAYNRWLAENRHRLRQMNDLERQGFLWEQREALFGDAAPDIWSEEVLAYEKRKQEMRDTISLLDASDDTTIEEKLDIYKDTLHRAYEDSPEAYILENKSMLARVFFSIDSVQKELEQMPPEHRQWEINQIRRDLGFNEELIQQMEARDAHRNRRWKNGREYMQAREAIVEQYPGPQQEEKLEALREEYFGHEAETIEREEKDGFFRYERERVYGRN